MSDFITPNSPEYTILLPEDLITWFVFGVWFVLVFVIVILLRDRKVNIDRRSLSWLAVLSALVLVLTPFFGVMPFPEVEAPEANLPINHLMLFAAVPWMVGCGVLGVVPAGMIAGISGLLLAYLDTHQIATPLLFMTVSLIFGQIIRQDRSAVVNRIIRFPVVAAVFAWLISTPLVFLSLILSASGPIGLRFASAIDFFPRVFLAFGAMLLLGGLVATLIRVFLPQVWLPDRQGDRMKKSRNESRLIAQMGLLLLVLVSIMVISVWRIAENTARGILVEEMTDSAGVAADGLALFVISGKSQIEALAAKETLAIQEPEALMRNLEQISRSQSEFDILSVFTVDGALIGFHSSLGGGTVFPTPEESLAVARARDEMAPSVLPVPPAQDGGMTQVSFLMPIQDANGQVVRVLLGRTSLAENPIFELILGSLETLENNGGMAQVIDEQGRRLYHTNPNLIMTDYANPRLATTTFYESTNLDNEPMMMFYQTSNQAGWAVVTAFPAEVRHLMAWEIAQPLFFAGISGLLILLLVIFILVSPLVREMSQLKSGISGVLAKVFPSDSLRSKGWNTNYEDVFSKTFDTLNRRVQQQRDLLRILGQTSLSTNLEKDLLPVMKAALAQGVSSVRIVLESKENPSNDEAKQGNFGLGRNARLYAALDQQVYSIVHSEGPFTLQDFQIGQRLSLPEGIPYPAALIALPLKSSGNWLGVLWAAFPEKRDPGKEDENFFNLLAGRASEILDHHAIMKEFFSLQKRMETALDETPQGLLITDEKGKVVYHNPRLREILDISDRALAGRDAATIFRENGLSELASDVEKGLVDKEIHLPGGRIFVFRNQPVFANGKPAGSAMIFVPLRGFKTRLDSRSELVTLVSHALRSPLTLIHGYAKILRLTGNLNEQQDDYIVKIITGIEEMRSLVQNLLDVGRLESQGLLDLSEFQVSQVLNKIKDNMEAQFRQKNIKFSVSLPEEPLMIQGDFTLLTQAVKNLVDNALKFTKMGGEVSLRVWERDVRVVFAVEDTGAGISPLDQRHLFEKFQADRNMSGEDVSGSGLGLVIVRSIIEHHDGKVWLESQLGKGSTFFIEIPKQQD